MTPDDLMSRLVQIAENELDKAFNDGNSPDGGWLAEHPSISDKQLNCFELMLMAVMEYTNQIECGHDECKVKAFNELANQLQLVPMNSVLAIIRELVIRRTIDQWQDGIDPGAIELS